MPNDKHHREAVQTFRANRELRILPEVVLPELFYVAAVRAGYEQVIRAVRTARSSGIRRETLLDSDLLRVEAIMQQYAEARFDFVDTVLMALAERLDVQTVFTFD